jgi:hypothetical protein
MSAQGGEKSLSNEARLRRLAQRRFWIALGVSLILHAILLGWPWAVGERHGESAFQGGMVAGGRFEVRLVSPAQGALQAGEPQRTGDAPQTLSVVPVPSIRQGTEDGSGAADGGLPSSPPEANPVLPGFPDVRYFAKEELSKEPRLVGNVSLDPPRGVSPPDGAKIALRLWIKETGSVDRIVVVRTSLPVIMTEFTVAAFAAARYQPGEINGEAVKSQLAIEVTYDVNAPPKTLRLPDPPSPRVR